MATNCAKQLRQMVAKDGERMRTKSGKFIAALCCLLSPGFGSSFYPTDSLGDGVSKRSRLSSFRKPSESRSAERIKLGDDGRTERAF